MSPSFDKVTSPEESSSSSDPPFALQNIPGKGKGLISTRSLSPGECIISEVPLFTTVTLTNANTIEQDLRSIIKSLPKDSQRAFLSLHNNFPGSPTPFSNLVRSNGYPLGPSSDIGGIFPLVSRLNHSCLPNAQHAYNERQRRMLVHIIRPITSNEEITLSYIPGGPSSQRQLELKQNFLFACTCELCSLPPSEKRKSDERLSRAAVLDSQIGSPRLVYTSPVQALHSAHELSSIYQLEQILDLRLPRLYYDAFQIVAMHSDLARAREFARLARDSRRICEGPESEELERLEGLMEDPRRFENWGAAGVKWRSKVDNIPECDKDREEFEKWLWRL
ncbi:SET domain-containing protein 5 [Pseudocercospora fuligena]|uniref:SET domain-containing protein 5 n=1 Tax=Pseudocercospora fuligena TaxID=685502 RepID=A0A8H6RGW9_9PEZI|nr:SET domain-containing protein 5 [Pseudocercospora fuligena]